MITKLEAIIRDYVTSLKKINTEAKYSVLAL